MIKRRLIQTCACISTVELDIARYALYLKYCNVLTISIPMYIEIGTGDRRRCIDIRNVVSEIREKVCLALPAFHLFIGND